MDLGIKDKTALVTASSKGIGRSIAETLSEEGCNLIICSRNLDNIQKAAEEIEHKTNNSVTPFVVDLTSKNSVDHFVKELKKKCLTVDILVNNTAGPPFKYHHELNENDWQESFNLTFMSVIRISVALIPLMKQRKWGRIIFLTAIAVKEPGILVVNAIRSSVASYAKIISNELGADNILVNTICPSYTTTERYYEILNDLAQKRNMTAEQLTEERMENVALGRPAASNELANMVVFLASEKASYVTGTCIQVDGGLIKSVF